MVASKDSSAPLVVVVGITGNQGGSVADHLVASDKPYRIVGLTRDASRPAAKAFAEKGVVLKEVDLKPGNEAAVGEAFKGADIVYAVTNFAELRSEEAEFAQGKLIVDAAKAAGVKLFIWSSLEPIAIHSAGKYRCPPFEAKHKITEYLTASSVPYALVPAGGYLTNLIGGGASAPAKVGEGKYVLYMPVSDQTVVPIVDTRKDYGAYVRAVIENPKLGAGSEVLTGVPTTFEEQLKALSEYTGASFTFKCLTKEEWVAKHGPFSAAFYDMWNYTQDFNYYAKKDIEASQKKAGITPPSFAEQLKSFKPEVFLEKPAPAGH